MRTCRPFSSKSALVASILSRIPLSPGRLSSSSTVPPKGTPFIAALPSASPNAWWSMLIEASAPHAVISVSTVTRVVFPAAADTASPSASRSAGTSRTAGAAPDTSCSSNCTCSTALLSSAGVRKRNSTFRSLAACSMPFRMAETLPSPSRRITDISNRAGW